MEKTVKENLNELALTDVRAFLEELALKMYENDEDTDKEEWDGFSCNGDKILDEMSGEMNSVDGIFLENVQQDGGGEGGGDSVDWVWQVHGLDCGEFFIQLTGYYASNYGTEWDDNPSRVYPKQVMVTQYFDKP